MDGDGGRGGNPTDWIGRAPAAAATSVDLKSRTGTRTKPTDRLDSIESMLATSGATTGQTCTKEWPFPPPSPPSIVSKLSKIHS